MAIRVGFVGLGANCRERHVPGLRAISGVEMAAVANRTRASAERAAAEFGIPRVLDRWQDLVEDPGVDAVVIGTWPDMHCPVTLAALQAGKHVLCEARMARNLEEARQMLAAAQARREIVAQLVPAPFTLRVDAAVRRLLAADFVGDLLAIDVVGNSAAFVDARAPLHWRQDAARSGQNILSMGIWYECLMRWVGPAVRVVAAGKTCVGERLNPDSGARERVNVPDHLDVVAVMECGAQAHLQFSAVTGFAPAPHVCLYGSHGTLRFELEGARLLGARRGDAEPRPVEMMPGEEGRWRVEEEFINAIRGFEAVRRTTFEDGVRYMQFTAAVAESLASGRMAALPPA